MRVAAWVCACLVVAAGCGNGGTPPTTVTTESITYGDAPQQYGVLSVPPGDGPHPVVVLIHGGFWRNAYDLALANPQALDAVDSGYAAWNVEYRRVGDDGGGYPGTLLDVAAAIDELAELGDRFRLDLDRVAVVGHSAGGHLAMWSGQRGRLGEGSAGADPRVVPALVVGQAPVADFDNTLDLGGDAVVEFMGGSPDDVPAAYAVADPARLLPIEVPQLIVHGIDDPVVPYTRSLDYEARVDDPDRLEVLTFPQADHFTVIEPTHESWLATKARLP